MEGKSMTVRVAGIVVVGALAFSSRKRAALPGCDFNTFIKRRER